MNKRWIITFTAIDPHDPKKTWEVGLFEQRLKMLTRQGHDSKLAQLRLVEEILEKGGTERLYGGWSRPQTDDCFVYVGRPKSNWTSLTIETPAPTNCLFLVFVLADGTIADWTWRPCSDDDPFCPSGVTGELQWPLIQK